MSVYDKMKEQIREVVQENAGGVKFTQLVAEMVVVRVTEGMQPPSPHLLEELIGEMPDIGILKYASDLGGGMEREKMFVYRKSKEST
jgi:hypothetical protein